MPEVHTVAGTRFVFPSLPEADEIGFDLFERLHGSREKVLAAAAKAKHSKPAKPRAIRVKPGDGTFTPKPGAPGASVAVTLVDVDGIRPSITVTGCVMFPAPGAHRVWLSLWDGRMPINVGLYGDKTSVEIRVSGDYIATRTTGHHQ